MISQEDFLLNLHELSRRIEDACSKFGRQTNEVTLLPVTKNWPVDVVRYCSEADINRVGENRVQEALSKQDQISGISWELIGHLQSNKVKHAVGRFARIQTIDSIKLIQKVQAVSENTGQKTKVLLQVNAGNDPAKYGFSINDAPFALDKVMNSSNLVVDGLMTIAPYVPEDLSVAKDCFRKLADLRDALSQSHGVVLQELSMGMSDDLQEAIECGSTMIRVGSALFGKRN